MRLSSLTMSLLILLSSCSVINLFPKRTITVENYDEIKSQEGNPEILFSTYSRSNFAYLIDGQLTAPQRKDHLLIKIKKPGYKSIFIPVDKKRNLASLLDIGTGVLASAGAFTLRQTDGDLFYDNREAVADGLSFAVAMPALTIGILSLFSKKRQGVLPKKVELKNIEFQKYLEKNENYKSVIVESVFVNTSNTKVRRSALASHAINFDFFKRYPFHKAINDVLEKSNFQHKSAPLEYNPYVKLQAEVFDLEIQNPNVVDIQKVKVFPFTQISAKVKWRVVDIFSEEVLEEIITDATSPRLFFKGEMSYDFSEGIMYEAFNELIKKEKFQHYILLDQNESTHSELSLYQSNPVVTIDDAVNSSVLIKSGNHTQSGFIIANEGYILTTASIVGAKDIDVIYGNNKSVKADLVRFDQKSHLALLKLVEVKDDFPNQSIVIGNAKNYIGQDLYLVRSILEEDILRKSISNGIVSGFRSYNSKELVQTDASINAGAEGGPAITKDGVLLGVIAGKHDDFGDEGIGFFIDAQLINKALQINFQN